MLWEGKLKRQEYVEIGSSSMKILCDNSIPGNQLKSQDHRRDNLMKLGLNKQSSNIMGISKQKLQNIYTYPDREGKFTSIVNGH